jgi:four helix bundle protein
MAYQSFEDLEVWKKALTVSVKVYDILNDTRDYGLKDQMTKAAVSIASNIAEGAERDSNIEFARFLHIAKSSS